MPATVKVIQLPPTLTSDVKVRSYALKAVIAAGLISFLLLSPKLWITTRLFPLTPVFTWLPALPFPFDYYTYYALIALLVVIMILPVYRALILCFAFLFIIAALMDQARWHFWAYQFFFMLLAYGVYSRARSDNDDTLLNTSRLIIVSVYFWAGIQKMNQAFMQELFPWLMEPITKLLPDFLKSSIDFFGLFAPFVEVGIAVGLLSCHSTYRRLAVATALLLHTFILFVLGPFGHNFNSVVWPWNMAMMLMVLILFYPQSFPSWRQIMWNGRSLFHAGILLLFGFMPALSFINLWDSYLSAALYSENTNSASLFISGAVAQRLPAGMQMYVQPDSLSGNRKVLDMWRWSMNELNVPPYPEKRIFKNVSRVICQYATRPDDVMLVIYGRRTPFNRERQTTLFCGNLQGAV